MSASSSDRTPASASSAADDPDLVAQRPRQTAPPATLDPFFQPRSIAVIGASDRPGSVGRTVLSNLLAVGGQRPVYPVNPKRESILDQRAYPSVAAIGKPIDLAVIVTPAPSVPALVQECTDAKIPAVIVISAGFKELGEEGQRLEEQILAIARRGGTRVVGPNCLGLMNPIAGVNATFARGSALPGKVAFLSQSGALCTAILDWSRAENVGFSAFVSLGSMLDVGWGEMIDYFGQDPHTQSILLYMESVGDARSFLSAAREVALSKPIIVIKGGRTESASKAAASHTGALAGSDLVFEAALDRVGVLRVDRIAELFSMAAVLARQPLPHGNRLTIVTNAGGPGVLATDALVEGGGQLAELAPETKAQLDALLPPHWSRGNPIDVLGDADATRYASTLAITAKDPNTDGFLVILTPQDMTDPAGTAAQLTGLGRLGDKPVLASWMGGPTVAPAVHLLTEAQIPNFPFPDTAARAFNYLWRYRHTLDNIYETPSLVADGLDNVAIRNTAAHDVVQPARQQGRHLLNEEESKRLLKAYGIPVVTTRVARTVPEAVAAATEIGFPVVLKLFSHTITHKTDVGGVKLNLRDGEQVAAAFAAIRWSCTEKAGAEHFQGVTVQPMVKVDGCETILGSTLDPQFGPVIMFGAGGVLVEVLQDRSFSLPPLNETLARRMIERTRIYRVLKGTRGRAPADLDALTTALINFGHLLVEQPWIRECDINPLIVTASGVVALDARVVLHPPDTRLESLPQPAIRPYPMQYVKRVKLADGSDVVLRPIRLEDEPLIVKFHEALSDESVRRRYFQVMKLSQRIQHDRMIRICFNDYDRDMAVVAEGQTAAGEPCIYGVARLSRTRRSGVAEFAVTVADPWQRRGIGTQLLLQLLEIARRERFHKVVGRILSDNYSMQSLAEHCGFRTWFDDDEQEYRAEYLLDTP